MSLKLDLINVVMTDKNESTGTVMCRGTMTAKIDGWGESKHDNLNFRLEKTTNGDLVATVYTR